MTDLPGRPSRRGFLKASAAGMAVASLPLSANAQQVAAPVPLDQYQPVFFTPAEWAFVMAATARLIPSEGDGPGAIETRVPVFIDLQLAGAFGQAADWYMEGPFSPAADPFLGWQTPLTPAEVYRQAIPVFDAWCAQTYNASFTALDAARQDEALAALEEAVMLAPEIRDFFVILLDNTKEGYFSDPIHGGNHGMQAWVYIGFPGARGAFLEWVERHDVPYPLGPVSISGERA